MKKLLLALAFVAASVALYANPICYFTYGQARRTVHFLNTQDELVIYCGHTYELETYVIISDIWMERVNSRYYEVWLYGIDAYTGDEIYMPLDLGCVWLLDRWSNTMYNAARYLHFQIDAPYTTLVWSMPVYSGFVRVAHPTHYRRSYHYDIHRHGWRPAPEYALPVYYMRPPTAPLPVIAAPYVPGRERPTVHVDNSLPSRPQPSTTRTASTPVRNSSTTPTPATSTSNRQPSSSQGTSDTRTSGTTIRTTSTTPTNPTTNTSTGRTPSTSTGRPTSSATTTPATTPTSTTAPSRTTTPSRTTAPSRTTSTPQRTINDNKTATKTTTTTPQRPTSTSTRSSSTSTTTTPSRNTSTSPSQQRTPSNSGRPTSTTNRTSSTGRR